MQALCDVYLSWGPLADPLWQSPLVPARASQSERLGDLLHSARRRRRPLVDTHGLLSLFTTAKGSLKQTVFFFFFLDKLSIMNTNEL